MKQTQLFTKTRREAPKDEAAKNAQLLIRAGYIHKDLAGVYSYLPLGLRVLNKINGIIREEMEALGAVELHLAALQNPELWQQTGRWSDKAVDVWFKTKLKNDSELGLGFTHEEPLTNLLRDHIKSYRDLPVYPYQLQTKFRNETRAKSGLMRGREFLMKDLYSFNLDASDHAKFYESAKLAYQNIFNRVGIGEQTYLTLASGGAFSQWSHEFQTICEAGEDTIYVAADKKLAVNLEVATDGVLADLGLVKEELVPHKAIEVGNIFNLGTRFSDSLGLTYLAADGSPQPVWMGSYGIGPGRLIGTIAEILADAKGLVWPEVVAPFTVHLLSLFGKDQSVKTESEKLYEELKRARVEVLWDDREVASGEKFADSDLLGLPYRMVVSERTISANKVEVKKRTGGEAELLTVSEMLSRFKNHV